ncbi:DUF2254 domain-containing protein [Gordonia jinghuaiqii]|uniref:DUF2254 domain-containing protein n=1 Tax=Gordonia jinghuaiqii TaxID=2758710 RepID=A0A7D7LRP2_9ACTN|nr:DUF2254 family protein [Gordonia jinghuaiqii]MCR5978916.1 DUF2254 domain-containing protein [Gordonia jinghuaiqii]QMT01745.1 DUF2254 domain-containing protein [Gordonia jinghuaiqii]
MTRWFDERIVEPGRLPLLILLLAFVLTFLFIRFSVRMIRAEVSWWPGNVTPGGLHVHHVFFGMMLMLLSGFGFVAVDPLRTPVVDCILAALFGIGSALVLDEFALILHLRDVYWSEEGRASIDAVFVAIAIGLLFLLGLQPFGAFDIVGEIRDETDTAARIAVTAVVVLNVILAVITLLKGKVWTGLVGMFIPILLWFGALRLARPQSPWARWRYTTRERKMARATDREQRYREPVMRRKIILQEAVAGRFGLPDKPPPPVPVAAVDTVNEPVPGAFVTALRWRRTRKELRAVPIWRLPVVLVTLAIVAAWFTVGFDQLLELEVDPGTLATLLSVIAGSMATLTGLVFTAVTLAMQFGASSISVRVIPMLQQEPVMRWSTGFFLATFVYSVIIAIDLSVGEPDSPTPGLSTAIAFVLTTASAYLFIALVGKVGTILNTARLLQWIADDGRAAILRQYQMPPAPPGEESDHPRNPDPANPDPANPDPANPDPANPDAGEPPEDAATEREALVDDARSVIPLGEVNAHGRVLLAVNGDRLRRLALGWGVRIDVLVAVGDHVPRGHPVVAIIGDPTPVITARVLGCLLFGDSHQPSVSPAAALQAISDIALKAMSAGSNDPSVVVQALDHTEDLLLFLAPRVSAEARAPLTSVRGIRRSWADYVAIGTDEIRRHSAGQAQVQRRLRALFESLLTGCAPAQRVAVVERLAVLDGQAACEWQDDLDRKLAGAADRQGYGSEFGGS